MSSSDAVEIPLIKATNESLKGYGYLIDSYESSDIEIVTWPKQGWRDIEEGTGNEGGTTEGPFEAWWEQNILYGRTTIFRGQGIKCAKRRGDQKTQSAYVWDRVTITSTFKCVIHVV